MIKTAYLKKVGNDIVGYEYTIVKQEGKYFSKIGKYFKYYSDIEKARKSAKRQGYIILGIIDNKLSNMLNIENNKEVKEK